MIKKYFCFVIVLLSFFEGFSQNSPQFTQYVFNQFYLNPGATGVSKKTNVQTIVRSQYTGYAADVDPGGGIISSVTSADLPFAKIKGGIGIYFSTNKFLKTQADQEFQLSYAFHKKLNNGSLLGLGVSTGISAKKLYGENYRPRDEQDPLIPSKTITLISPNLNIGAFYYTPNYQVGLSIKNLLEPSYKINSLKGVLKDKREFIASGKIDFGVSYSLDVSPMIIVKSDLNSISTELGVLANYNQKYWGGVNYRWQDAASVLVGGNFMKNNLKLGFAIDFVNFGTVAKSATSQELFVRYILGTPKGGKKSIIKTPRYSI
jgi:type IX secretion system PorP/SprF family membrane protein